MEKMIEEIKNNTDRLETLFESAMRKVDERDETIKKKDDRIAELSDKLNKLQHEKSEVLQKKIDLMKEIENERQETTEKLHNQKLKINELSNELSKIKKSKKDAQDSAMGSSFEQDKLRKKLIQKTEKVKELQDKLAQAASGNTGMLFDKKGVIEYLSKRIDGVNRNLRLVVPNIDFLKTNDLLEKLTGLASSCVVNIACDFDRSIDEEIISDWQELGFRLTNYKESNLICVSGDGANVGIAFMKGNTYSGFFTDIIELVNIFNQAIMQPFIKGEKI